MVDLEVESPHDFLLGNGVLSHNSHATEYSLIAVWTAWLRHYYPPEFWAGRLTIEGDAAKAAEMINFARASGVRFLLPDVSRSGYGYRVEDGCVRVGYTHLLGVGEKAGVEIEAGQPYESVEDFIAKSNLGRVNRAVIGALVDAGAFDDLAPNRRKMRGSIEELFERRKRKVKAIGQTMLFDTEVEVEDWSDEEKIRRRFSVLPLPAVDSILDLSAETLGRMRTARTGGRGGKFFSLVSRLHEREREDEYVQIAGVALSVEAKTGKDRAGMLDWHVFDHTASSRCRMYSDRLIEYDGRLHGMAGRPVLIQARTCAERAIMYVEHVALLDALSDSVFDRWLFDPVDDVEMGGETWRPVDVLGGKDSNLRRVGVVSRVRTLISKRSGREMAFALLLGRNGCRELAIWDEEWRSVRSRVKVGNRISCVCRRRGPSKTGVSLAKGSKVVVL